MVFKLIDSLVDGAFKAVDATVDAGFKAVDRKIDGTFETIDHALDTVFTMKNKMTGEDGRRIASHLLNPLDGVEGLDDAIDCPAPDDIEQP